MCSCVGCPNATTKIRCLCCDQDDCICPNGQCECPGCLVKETEREKENKNKSKTFN